MMKGASRSMTTARQPSRSAFSRSDALGLAVVIALTLMFLLLLLPACIVGPD